MSNQYDLVLPYAGLVRNNARMYSPVAQWKRGTAIETSFFPARTCKGKDGDWRGNQ